MSGHTQEQIATILPADRECLKFMLIPACHEAVDRGDYDTHDDMQAIAQHRLNAQRELLEALRPFTDIGPQTGAWGVVSKKLDDMAPLTVTVTKAQMKAALAAIAKATGADRAEREAR